MYKKRPIRMVPPVDSLWDLTREEMGGPVFVMVDRPSARGLSGFVMTEIVFCASDKRPAA